jgi:phospholipase/lecithinase/hemolysin
MHRATRKLLAAAASLFILQSGPAGAVPYSGLVVFGDSLADSGNNAIVFDLLAAPLPPGTLRTPTPLSAADIIPIFPYASGRYSNGPVWVEHLAAALDLSAAPFLAGGSNFAFGGARSAPGDSDFPPSLLEQVGGFLSITGGNAPGDALYIVQGGGNDARDALEAAALSIDPTALMAGYALSTAQAVFALQLAGAQDIVVANIPDLGKAPAVLAQYGAEGAAAASALVLAMNDAMLALLGELPDFPSADIRLLDLYAATGNVVDNPGAFGMTDVTSMCAFSAACIADPSSTLFWDGIHPTTAGHALLAREALAVLLPEPQTQALTLAALGLLAFSIRRRRRA